MIFFPFSNNSGFGVFLVHLETMLPKGLETSGQRAYHKFWHIARCFWVFAIWMFFSSSSVFQKNQVFGYSWSTLLWYWCYCPHRSRDALSPVCWIFYNTIHIRPMISSLWGRKVWHRINPAAIWWSNHSWHHPRRWGNKRKKASKIIQATLLITVFQSETYSWQENVVQTKPCL